MTRVVVLAVLVMACEDPKRVPAIDAAIAGFIDAAPLPLDAPPPPPTVDAGPPPAMACSPDAGTCELPPSTCLDTSYLLYYTAASCEFNTCMYASALMWCQFGCYSGGCMSPLT